MSKLQKSHYKDGQYFDTTTGTFYTPKDKCELCKGQFGLQVHHKLPQSKCIRDLKTKKTKNESTWTQDFINDNQKLFTLCLKCHSNVHSFSYNRFKFYYNKNISDYIYKHLYL